MSWCRAVWQEGKREEEGIVPSHWIEDNIVRWPKVSNASKLLTDRTKPSNSWWKFPLMKLKFTSGVFSCLILLPHGHIHSVVKVSGRVRGLSPPLPFEPPAIV